MTEETPDRPNGTEIVRKEFGAQQVTHVAETATTAVAAQARAAIESRYIVARANRRDWDQVRSNLIEECKRPSFARVARYHKPVGKGVEGPSIRFAEATIREMTNVQPETSTIFDDATKRIIRIAVTDLEANVTYSKDVVVEKVVERSSVKPGQSVISKRINSQGKTVYLVAATEDDLLNKEAALASKAMRGLALRLLPGDILDECMEKVIETLNDQAAKDPDAERKKIVDAFAGIGVKPLDLKGYIGHELDQLRPPEVVQLRAIFSAIRDGETTWTDVIDHKLGPAKGEQPNAPMTLTDVARQKSGRVPGEEG